ncbi:MAG: membrane-bound PQQ-dependent dehydrogenase, glucose/quinate/shikimate family, partial [Phyllobacterium sp.]
MAIALTALVFLLIGALLGFGGVWLAILGGSWYYIVAALAFLVTSFLLFRRRASALLVYALLVIGTLGWAIWEIGFDWWQLAPRGGVIMLLGLWLLTPWIRRGLASREGNRTSSRAPAIPLLVTVLAALAIAGYSMSQDPLQLAGELSSEAVSDAPDLGGTMPDGDWHQYGRTPYGQRYSPLKQITPENVGRLQVAWTYQTGDVRLPEDVGETTYQVTPLKVRDTLYVCTPHNWAIALDASTGKEKWKFDPNVGLNPDRQHQTCRGVSYYADPAAAPGQPCAERVYLPTSDARLIALDAANGEICPAFADKGTLHLEKGMPYNPAGYYYSTSPPVVAAGKIIVGGAVNDNYSTQEQSGVI